MHDDALQRSLYDKNVDPVNILSNLPFAGVLLNLRGDGVGGFDYGFVGVVCLLRISIFGGTSRGGERGADAKADGGGATADEEAVGESEAEARRRGRFAAFWGGR